MASLKSINMYGLSKVSNRWDQHLVNNFWFKAFNAIHYREVLSQKKRTISNGETELIIKRPSWLVGLFFAEFIHHLTKK